jgi:hypothetical protein
MAMRKMTFTIPDEVATPFLRVVPSARRSKFVADALRRTLKEREDTLIAACDAVNADPALNVLVDEWQAVNDLIEEPWDESASR